MTTSGLFYPFFSSAGQQGDGSLGPRLSPVIYQIAWRWTEKAHDTCWWQTDDLLTLSGTHKQSIDDSYTKLVASASVSMHSFMSEHFLGFLRLCRL
jgi:hypothetical protein